MTAKLAIPTFVGGAKDALAALDVYKDAADEVVNSIQERYLDDALGLDSLIEVLGGDAMALYANEALGEAMEALPTEADVLERIESAVPEVASGLLDMTALGKGNILAAAQSMLPGVSSITATIGGVTSQLSKAAGSFTDIKAMAGVINGITGGTLTIKITDLGGVVGTLSTVVNKATSMGIPNAFGAVMSYSGISTNLGNLANTAINQVVGQVLPSVIRSGDLGSLSSMASALGTGGMGALFPNVVNTVARGYTAPAGARTLTDYEEACATAQATFEEMQPGWNLAKVGSAVLPSITALTGASPDFQKIIHVGAVLSSDSTQKLQLLSRAFPQVGSVMGSLSKSFPQAVIRDVVNLGTLDPRVATTNVPDVNRQALQAGIPQPVRTTPSYEEDPWGDLLMSNTTPGYQPGEEAINGFF